jgi:hypothetical protein
MLLLCPALVVSGLLADPAAGTQGRLTDERIFQVRGGMTLAETEKLLGPLTVINPNPAPFATFGDEVLVVWREGRLWVGVVFVRDQKCVLRVLNTGETHIGWGTEPMK